MVERLNIIIASKAEAVPLINILKLVKENLSNEYTVYLNQNIHLYISGIGATSTQRVVEYACQRSDQFAPGRVAYLNVGIAGTKHIPFATLVWPASVGEFKVNQTLPNGLNAQGQVLSLPSPSAAYQEGVFYDMEAQAICTQLTTMASHAPVFCAKVISDNEGHEMEQITPHLARELIQQHIEPLAQVVTFIQTFNNSIAP